MLNQLTQYERCIITTTDGDSIAGVYGGVETPHGDWSVLVQQGLLTLSIPVACIQSALTAPVT
jgi:hypothetical protein